MSEQSYQNNAYYFTNFLSAGDAALVYQAVDRHTAGNGNSGGNQNPSRNHDSSGYQNSGASEFTLWGGAEGCERVMIRFGNEEELGYSVPFPIQILQVEPLNKKFADDLTHRDYLGALMNLGIERDTIGDIVVKDNRAYMFVLDSMAEYICQNMDKVKHTNVKCMILDTMPEEVRVELAPETVIVASIRLDAVIAKLYHISRTEALDLFRKKYVIVNGRICENNSAAPKENDVIAVRGHGKFIYRSLEHETKKGKLSVLVERYV